VTRPNHYTRFSLLNTKVEASFKQRILSLHRKMKEGGELTRRVEGIQAEEIRLKEARAVFRQRLKKLKCRPESIEERSTKRKKP